MNARAVLPRLFLLAAGLGLLLSACGAPTPLPPTATAPATRAPTATVPAATNTPAEPSPTPTATIPPTEANQFSPTEVEALVLADSAAPDFTPSVHNLFGPDDPHALQDWIGTTEAAQPFIDAGLQRIATTIFDPVPPCAKVCFIISSALIFANPTFAGQAPLQLLNSELSNNDTAAQLTDAELTPLTSASTSPGAATLVGTQSTTGTGDSAQTTFNLYSSYRNAVLVLQAGGPPASITLADAFAIWESISAQAAALR